mgnify:CR=1 FL=1|tara:strand:+ start:178 stop:486 length:309 start_codon:yes stop_codon:yes gene_type:complete
MTLTITLTDDNGKVIDTATMTGPGVAVGMDVAERWRLTQLDALGNPKHPSVLTIIKSTIADTVGRMADSVGSAALKNLRDAKLKADADLEAAKANLIAAVKA